MLHGFFSGWAKKQQRPLQLPRSGHEVCPSVFFGMEMVVKGLVGRF